MPHESENLSKAPAISIQGLSVTYKGTGGGLPTFRNRLSKRTREHVAPKEIHAINDLSIDVYKGQILGVVGHNGAGKTTLLRTISGILPPTKGRIEVRGEVLTLLSLGIGMAPELSGYENVVLAGLASGLKLDEVNDRLDDIVEFSGIGDFVAAPMRTYSAGMASRLAFSLAVHMQPEILLVDEALSAGDAAFKDKAERKMRDLMSKAHTIVVVSHSMQALLNMCTDILWLDHGNTRGYGKPEEVVDAYLAASEVSRTASVMEDL